MKKKPDAKQVQIRMDEELMVRVKNYLQKLEKDDNLKISFSSASRSLIEKGLDAAGF